MAVSPAHRFGQTIGEALEAAVLPLLIDFAKGHGLYLDRKGPRPCRKGKKCAWVDRYKNTHDLDFVLERGGTPEKLGTPVAFIETAWRRYTKHSRNKAQEIQGAILPLAETYQHVRPFKGAILAGVFTDGALAQLRSLGFLVLYFPYETVVEVFRRFGVDAYFTEATADRVFAEKVRALERLRPEQRVELAGALLHANAAGVAEFIRGLEAAVSRGIHRVVVLPLHGKAYELESIDEAVRFIEGHDEERGGGTIERYEIQVRYNNGDVIEGKFQDRKGAIEFLRSYQPPVA